MTAETRIRTEEEIARIGALCLIERLGHVDAERFYRSVRTGCPDYTVWRRRRMYDDMTLEDLIEMVKKDAAEGQTE